MQGPAAHNQPRTPEELIEPLSYIGDHVWLEQVGVALVDEQWLATANELVVVGSADLRYRRELNLDSDSIVQARSRFYGEALGWDSPRNPVHAQYKEHKRRSPTLPKVSVAVEAMRLMSRMGLDPVDILSMGFAVLGTHPEATKRRITQMRVAGQLGRLADESEFLSDDPSDEGGYLDSLDL